MILSHWTPPAVPTVKSSTRGLEWIRFPLDEALYRKSAQFTRLRRTSCHHCKTYTRPDSNSPVHHCSHYPKRYWQVKLNSDISILQEIYVYSRKCWKITYYLGVAVKKAILLSPLCRWYSPFLVLGWSTQHMKTWFSWFHLLCKSMCALKLSCAAACPCTYMSNFTKWCRN